MPAGADTVFMQEDVRAEGDAVDRAAGPEARRQPPARRRGRAQGRGRAAGRAGGLQPQDVALAAALGLTTLDGAAARARRAVLDRRRDRRAGRAAARRRALRRQPLPARAACWSGSAPRSPISASSRDDPASAGARRSPTRRSDHDLVLTSGGVSTGEADHVRDAVEKIGTAGVLARRHQAGPAGGDGRDPGAAAAARPSSACRAIRSRCSSPSRAWCGRCCCGSPARRPSRSSRCRCGWLRLQEEEGPARICARGAARGADGAIEAVKHPQDGAGVITSLTETDGLAELAEDATTVEPGSTVGFLSYATLMGEQISTPRCVANAWSTGLLTVEHDGARRRSRVRDTGGKKAFMAPSDLPSLTGS